jgi:hypothetical protein
MLMNISTLRTSVKGGTAAFGATALNERSRLVTEAADNPLIQALVDRLPKSDSIWSIDDRAKWLKAAAMAFNLIYKTE